MHFVWSTVQNPTLYLSHTPNTGKSCSCDGSVYNCTLNSMDVDQNCTISIPGLDSPFSLAIIFTRIIEFDATEKNLAQEALNLTQVCHNDDTHVRFTDLNNIMWTFDSTTTTFEGIIRHNSSSKPDTTSIRIRVS